MRARHGTRNHAPNFECWLPDHLKNVCDCSQSFVFTVGGPRASLFSVLYLPGLSRYFDCFDSILEWDGISGMEVVFDSLIFFGRFDCLISILAEFCGSVMREVRTWEQKKSLHRQRAMIISQHRWIVSHTTTCHPPPSYLRPKYHPKSSISLYLSMR